MGCPFTGVVESIQEEIKELFSVDLLDRIEENIEDSLSGFERLASYVVSLEDVLEDYTEEAVAEFKSDMDHVFELVKLSLAFNQAGKV